MLSKEAKKELEAKAVQAKRDGLPVTLEMSPAAFEWLLMRLSIADDLEEDVQDMAMSLAEHEGTLIDLSEKDDFEFQAFVGDEGLSE